jgi:CheY-like chemotaxis protein
MDLEDVNTLIIDDNSANRLILRETLSRWGAVVTEAEGGEQGVSELVRAKQANVPYALVLLIAACPVSMDSTSPSGSRRIPLWLRRLS